MANCNKICSVCGVVGVYAKNLCKKHYNAQPHIREKINKTQREYRQKNSDKINSRRRPLRNLNKDKIKKQTKDWKEKNPDKIKQISKNYYENNKEEILRKNKEWRDNNKEKVRENNIKFYQKNKNNPEYKEKVQKNGQKWREDNKELCRERDRIYKKNKRKQDVCFKLRSNISRHIRKLLKTENSKKETSILQKLPYSIQELKEHLEKQWQLGWSWENYGTVWNIDHIIPQSKLLYDNLEHPNFLKCWCLTNLRPLSCLENNKKQDKLI